MIYSFCLSTFHVLFVNIYSGCMEFVKVNYKRRLTVT